MTILYTRACVAQAADALGDSMIAVKYFNEDPKAFTLVDTVLKDANYDDGFNG